MSTSPEPNQSRTTDLLVAIGYILGVSYPLLALSTGVRAIYQAFVRSDLSALSIALSGLASLIYLAAAVAFFTKRRWAWRVGVAALAFETIMVLAVGTWSYVSPNIIAHTVWAHFGADYGYFPLIQPLLGLTWLIWPETLRRFGFSVEASAGLGGALRAAARALWAG